MTFPPELARVVDCASERSAQVLEAVARVRTTDRGASRIMRLIIDRKDRGHGLAKEYFYKLPK